MNKKNQKKQNEQRAQTSFFSSINKRKNTLNVHTNNLLSHEPRRSVSATPRKIRELYGHAMSLGKPIVEEGEESFPLAMDNQLEEAGFFSLAQHAYSMGQPPQGNGFIGYSTLSSLAENGFIISCVETVADDMVREWITFENKDSAEKQTDVSTKIAMLETAIEQFKLRSLFSDAVTKTRYFGGGLIFIDTGVTDAHTLRLPLDKSEKSAELRQGGLKGFTFIEPINVFPGKYNTTDPLSQDYFEPKSWWVLGKEVHASRFIKITTGDMPILLRPSYNFFGIPTAQILWDYVLHFQKDRIAASRMLGKYSDIIFKVGGLRDSLSQPDGSSQLDRRLSVMARGRNNDSVTAIDMDEEDIIKVESNLSGLTDIARQGLEFICAINRTPAVKLLGISPSGFNATGESDITNYNDHIGTMQEKVLRTPLYQALECLQLHLFGKKESAIAFSFNKLNKDDKQAENAIRMANTTMLAPLVDSQVLTPTGIKAVVEKNPSAFLDGILDGIEADEKSIEEQSSLKDREQHSNLPFDVL